jgi:ketol-acid reductoisomerase
MAYFECLHEVKLIVDAVFAEGIKGMHRRVSDTAEYGDYTRGRRVIGREARTAMKQILDEIRSGAFAREWIEENRKGRPNFNKLRTECDEHPVEKVGAELRSMMHWIKQPGGQAAPRPVQKVTTT